MYCITPGLTRAAQRVTLNRWVLDNPDGTPVTPPPTMTTMPGANHESLYDLCLCGSKNVELDPKQANSHLKGRGYFETRRRLPARSVEALGRGEDAVPTCARGMVFCRKGRCS